MSNKKWESHQAKDFSSKEVQADIQGESSLENDGPEQIAMTEETLNQRNEWEVKIGELTDRFLRLQADTDNREKRAQREIANAHKFALERFFRELIPVIDNLERALDVPANENTVALQIHEGVAMTLAMLLNLVQKFDVEVVNPLSQPFNSEFHEAVSVQEAEALGVSPNTVTTVLQKGYLLNGRLIRPAMVVVAK